jgi:ATP-binding cassette, subfamily B, bacterial
LARLLARLANPTGGEFLINDINAQNYDPGVLRSHIAVLFQDIGKYDGFTILENIGVGKVSELHSKDLIEESAKAAGADDFIDKLPYKYDSYLGLKPGATMWGHTTGRWDESDTDTDDDDEKLEKERVQKNLSGGQWQKIALARAFMRGTEADLLVLDEPTANLDPEAEYKLFETIKRIRKGLTTVYISHRFNTVRAADKIMVMGKGTVIEFGSHDDLMALKDGTYRRLYTLQAKGFQLDNEGGVSKDMDGLVLNVQEEMVKKIVAKGV